ncbi:MAG: cytidylate kinase-like family protein [Prevotella sp.]|nr:cytidylate kinase-like family protein [Bacteroides sp.]MCM1436625.1 cytidylate kinase-like family protein [Prevotella sp.]
MVIVIGRQFGAGGRKLGHELANRFSIPYYDKELLSEAAKRLGFKQEVFINADEKKPSLLHALLNFNYNSPTGHYTSSSMNADAIYASQSQVIRQIAQEGSCVIVGRTADYILRENPNLLSVFIHARPEIRAKRILDRGDAKTNSEALAIAKDRDKIRRDYYNYFTGRNWGHCSNYHLSIDSSDLTTEKLADIIQAAISSLKL